MNANLPLVLSLLSLLLSWRAIWISRNPPTESERHLDELLRQADVGFKAGFTPIVEPRWITETELRIALADSELRRDMAENELNIALEHQQFCARCKRDIEDVRKSAVAKAVASASTTDSPTWKLTRTSK